MRYHDQLMRKSFWLFLIFLLISAALPAQAWANPHTKIVTGRGGHSFLVQPDGTLWAWGDNDYGQLGLGDTEQRLAPVRVGTDATWKSVAVGDYHTLALKADGTIWTWGLNNFYQLGQGDTDTRTSPVQVGTGNQWLAVAAGWGFSVALRADGTLWAWGQNDTGALGQGDASQYTTLVQVGSDDDWLFVSANYYGALAIKADGTLWAWGGNMQGELGVGDQNPRLAPTQVGSDDDWIQVAAGQGHTHAIKSNGTLWAWGNNSSGQLGLGDTLRRTSPTQVGSDDNWLTVSAGDYFSLGIQADGTLWACGYSFLGALGRGSDYDSYSPAQVGSADNWVAVAAGSDASLGLTAGGELLAWGYNSSGQLGLGDTANRYTPTSVLAVNSGWLRTAGGGMHTLAIRSDGTLWAWGLNFLGQLGLGDTDSRDTPVQVGNGSNWKALAAGLYHSLAIKADGTLWAWGYNGVGQLGLGDTDQRNEPVQVGVDTDWKAVAAGYQYGLAIKADGTLWVWGQNTWYQLGLGDTDLRLEPTQLGSGQTWKAVTGGAKFTLGLQSDGTLWAWGDNEYGQLGLGDLAQRNSPVQVGADSDWKIIAGGVFHSLALKADGTLWAWGSNDYGELGLGDHSQRSTPEQVGADQDWMSISAGVYGSLAMKAHGAAWAWGLGDYGALGLGDWSSRSLPTQMAYDHGWTVLNSGQYHSLGLAASGSLWVWGWNNSGQLGLGDTDNRNTPTILWGQVTGQVTNDGGQPLAGVMVAAVPDLGYELSASPPVSDLNGRFTQSLSHLNGRFTWAYTDLNGRFTLCRLGLAATVLMRTDTEVSDLGYRDVFWNQAGGSTDSAQAEQYQVEPPPQLVWDFAMESKASLRGNIESDQGQSLAGAVVEAYTECGGEVVASAQTDANGDYTLLGLQPGSYYLKAQGDYMSTEWYDGGSGAADCAGASPISLADGQHLTATDIPLSAYPEINILRDGSPIGSIWFSSYTGMTVGDVVTSEFIIQNLGAADLHLTGTPAVAAVGMTSEDITVTAQPDATVPPGGQTSFTLKIQPAGHGARMAGLLIHSDDDNESVFYGQYGFWITVPAESADFPAPEINSFGVLSIQEQGESGRVVKMAAYADISGPGAYDLSARITKPDGGSVAMSAQYHKQEGTYYYYSEYAWNGPPEDGTYTLTVTDSAGRTASKAVEFAYQEVPLPSLLAPDDQAYVGGARPTLSLTPAAEGYFHAFSVRDYNKDATRLAESGAQADAQWTVPAGALQANTPYRWYGQVVDSQDGPCFNVARASRVLYTGERAASAAVESLYLRNALLGNGIAGGIEVAWQSPGLAPWDVTAWSLARPDGSTISDQLPTYNSTLHQPFWYRAYYDYYTAYVDDQYDPPAEGDYAMDLEANQGTANQVIAHTNEDLPSVGHEGRSPAFNAYVRPGATTLSWSAVAGDVKYVASVETSTGSVVWESGVLDGTSVTVPAGVLLPDSSYAWYLTVLDQGSPANNSAKTWPIYFSTLSALPAEYMVGSILGALLDAADSDNDGISDSIENRTCTSATNSDSDGDGIPDGVEDANRDGVRDAGESNPCSDDSDGDGLGDNEEDVNLNGVRDAGETDASNADTDGDGMPDKYEVDNGLDPLVNDAASDKDGDGYTNKQECDAGTLANDASSMPRPATIAPLLPLMLTR